MRSMVREEVVVNRGGPHPSSTTARGGMAMRFLRRRAREGQGSPSVAAASSLTVRKGAGEEDGSAMVAARGKERGASGSGG